MKFDRNSYVLGILTIIGLVSFAGIAFADINVGDIIAGVGGTWIWFHGDCSNCSGYKFANITGYTNNASKAWLMWKNGTQYYTANDTMTYSGTDPGAVLNNTVHLGNLSIDVLEGWYDAKESVMPLYDDDNVTINFLNGAYWNMTSTNSSFVGIGSVITIKNISSVINLSSGSGSIQYMNVNNADDVAVGQKVWILANTDYALADGVYTQGLVDIGEVRAVSGTNITLYSTLKYKWAATTTNAIFVDPVENFWIKGEGSIRQDYPVASDNTVKYYWTWSGGVKGVTVSHLRGSQRAILFASSNPLTSGITAIAGAAKGTIEGVTVPYAGEHCIEVYIGAADMLIKDSILSNCGIEVFPSAGISVHGTGQLIDNNRIYNASGMGIYLSSTRDNVVSNNIAYGGFRGFMLNGGRVNNVTFVGNMALGTKGYTFQIANSGPLPIGVAAIGNIGRGAGENGMTGCYELAADAQIGYNNPPLTNSASCD